ncbi:AraC family transcriptional regulator [Salibacterium lacus]|uniref:GyrI-like domain-containing protein n=1 Tax=Salibacterium lacus TaxID=1898109 RepID=A0ABW5T3T2_9BACI
MDSLQRMNDALRYVEEHLADTIDMEEAARTAYSSAYHFQRMFSFLAGMTLGEYIRRRRLTLAAVELQQGGAKVVDTAVKYGYHSPDAFTRAFQAQHGVSPSRAKKDGAPLQAYPPMTFQLTIQGGESMKYRIVQKESFSIAGLKKRVAVQFHGVSPEIEEMWQSLDSANIQELKALSNTEPSGLISASTHFSEGRMEENGTFDHYIGAATTNDVPVHWDELRVPASEWAVFEAAGAFPDALQDVWGRIYSEWFPGSGYEAAEGPEILWNESSDTTSTSFRSEIWIPVQRTSS